MASMASRFAQVFKNYFALSQVQSPRSGFLIHDGKLLETAGSYSVMVLETFSQSTEMIFFKMSSAWKAASDFLAQEVEAVTRQ